MFTPKEKDIESIKSVVSSAINNLIKSDHKDIELFIFLNVEKSTLLVRSYARSKNSRTVMRGFKPLTLNFGYNSRDLMHKDNIMNLNIIGTGRKKVKGNVNVNAQELKDYCDSLIVNYATMLPIKYSSN